MAYTMAQAAGLGLPVTGATDYSAPPMTQSQQAVQAPRQFLVVQPSQSQTQTQQGYRPIQAQISIPAQQQAQPQGQVWKPQYTQALAPAQARAPEQRFQQPQLQLTKVQVSPSAYGSPNPSAAVVSAVGTAIAKGTQPLTKGIQSFEKVQVSYMGKPPAAGTIMGDLTGVPNPIKQGYGSLGAALIKTPSGWSEMLPVNTLRNEVAKSSMYVTPTFTRTAILPTAVRTLSPRILTSKTVAGSVPIMRVPSVLISDTTGRGVPIAIKNQVVAQGANLGIPPGVLDTRAFAGKLTPNLTSVRKSLGLE